MERTPGQSERGLTAAAAAAHRRQIPLARRVAEEIARSVLWPGVRRHP